jgi:hypothetical protein
MKTISKTKLILISIATIISFVLAIKYIPQQREIVYNCSIAEISPDFPIKAREQCRKLNAERIK